MSDSETRIEIRSNKLWHHAKRDTILKHYFKTENSSINFYGNIIILQKTSMLWRATVLESIHGLSGS